MYEIVKRRAKKIVITLIIRLPYFNGNIIRFMMIDKSIISKIILKYRRRREERITKKIIKDITGVNNSNKLKLAINIFIKTKTRKETISTPVYFILYTPLMTLHTSQHFQVYIIYKYLTDKNITGRVRIRVVWGCSCSKCG